VRNGPERATPVTTGTRDVSDVPRASGVGSLTLDVAHHPRRAGEDGERTVREAGVPVVGPQRDASGKTRVDHSNGLVERRLVGLEVKLVVPVVPGVARAELGLDRVQDVRGVVHPELTLASLLLVLLAELDEARPG